jgi:hypothetical protein
LNKILTTLNTSLPKVVLAIGFNSLYKIFISCAKL